MLLTVSELGGSRAERVEVGVPHRLPRTDPLPRLEQEERREERDAVRVEAGSARHQRLRAVGGELVAGQLLGPGDPRPVVLGGGAQHLHRDR